MKANQIWLKSSMAVWPAADETWSKPVVTIDELEYCDMAPTDGSHSRVSFMTSPGIQIEKCD